MDSLYCSLCQMYFYTVVDCESHQLSAEHLERLSVQPSAAVATDAEAPASQSDGELELVQSDFIFLSSSSLPSGSVFGAYQASIRQVIPLAQCYVVLLDAVTPSLWDRILASFNQHAPTFPLFIQSGSDGRPPTDKRLIDYVLVVDLDPGTDPFQFSSSVSCRKEDPEILPEDVVLVPSDDGTDSTAFVRIRPGLNRAFTLQCIRNSYILPSYRKVNVFELWVPKETQAQKKQPAAEPPAARPIGTSGRAAPVKESTTSDYNASDMSNLNKDAHGLLASLSKKARPREDETEPSTGAYPNATPHVQYRVESVNPYFLARPVASRSPSPPTGGCSSHRRSPSAGRNSSDWEKRSRSPARRRSRSSHRSRHRSRRSGSSDRDYKRSGHDRKRRESGRESGQDGRYRRESLHEADGYGASAGAEAVLRDDRYDGVPGRGVDRYRPAGSRGDDWYCWDSERTEERDGGTSESGRRHRNAEFEGDRYGAKGARSGESHRREPSHDDDRRHSGPRSSRGERHARSDRSASPKRARRYRGSSPSGPEYEHAWSIKGGSQAYMRISGFKLSEDSVSLVEEVTRRLDHVQGAYALVPSKSVNQKAIICTFDLERMPSVNQVRERLFDLGSALFVQDYSPETFHQFKANKPFSFYFAPLPKEKAIEPVFIVLWNIPSDLPVNQLIYRARRAFPVVRSFCCPRYTSSRTKNCGYLVARFNSEADCQSVYEKLEQYSADQFRSVFGRSQVLFTFAVMQECCLIPPFSFPCHNFLIWVMDADSDSGSVMDSLPDRPYIPYVCPCHPDAMPIAPHAPSLNQVAKHIVDLLAAEGPEEVAKKLPELLKLEDSRSLKAGGENEDVPDSHRVPPIELNKINLHEANAYWCLLYGPDHFYSIRGFPLSVESLDAAKMVKDCCSNALNIYVQIYPQPLPQVLTKQVVFRVPNSHGYNPRTVKAELERRLSEIGARDFKLHMNEWGYRAWGRFKNLRPFMLPFSPVPLCYRKPHFILVWNINRDLGKHIFIRNFLNKFPQIRSAHSPNLQPGHACRNCEYCILRFDCPEHCVHTLAQLQLLTESEKIALCPNSDIRFCLCRMEETCYIPPFLFPCHNFFWWYGRSANGVAAKGDKLFVEPWDRSFECSCHPYCQRVTPSGPHLVKFSQMVREAVQHSSVEAVRSCLHRFIEASNDTVY